MKPLILIILDGWGISKEKKGNAILLAHTPNHDSLKQKYPFTTLKASGKAVGLLAGMMGNSETGHMNIGAGRVVPENIMRIHSEINNKTFYKNSALLKAISNAKNKNSTLHLMGLLSDAGVHAHIYHLFALLKLAKQHKLTNVMIHLFTDGRDTSMQYATYLIKLLKDEIKKTTGKIATITGRYFAMDRDKRWDRTKIAYEALVNAKGKKSKDPLKALQKEYKKGQTDEFIKPIIIGNFKGIKNNDSVIFFNFRTDRPRQLTKAFVEPGFNNFKTKKLKLTFVTMTEYYKGMPALIAFKHLRLKNILGEILSKNNIRQLRISETEKYAHVTFFFNVMCEKPFPKEDRILIPSPKVATYDLTPEMSVYEVTDALLKAIKSKKYRFILLNFVNPDMVGHTGKLEAAVAAIEAVDNCLGKVVKAIQEQDGTAIITADHGNAESMIDPKTKQPISTHTTNPVPFIIVSDKKYSLKKGILADIAPTILKLLGIKKPKEMTGKALF